MFRRSFRHDAWANATVLSALLAAPEAPAKAVAAFQHLLETEHTWFHRLLGDPQANVPLWSEPSLARCRDWFPEIAALQTGYLQRLSGETLALPCTYRNSKGAEFTDPVEDILQHVLIHSAQYRGEASGFAIAAGIPVPDVDYIFWRRLGEPGMETVPR